MFKPLHVPRGHSCYPLSGIPSRSRRCATASTTSRSSPKFSSPASAPGRPRAGSFRLRTRRARRRCPANGWRAPCASCANASSAPVVLGESRATSSRRLSPPGPLRGPAPLATRSRPRLPRPLGSNTVLAPLIPSIHCRPPVPRPPPPRFRCSYLENKASSPPRRHRRHKALAAAPRDRPLYPLRSSRHYEIEG